MSLVTSVNTQPRSLAPLPIPVSSATSAVPGAPPYWDVSSAYVVGDKVSYGTGTGFLRVCVALTPHAALSPAPFTNVDGVVTPSAGWTAQLSGEPLWDASATYFPGDVVSYSDSTAEAQLYMALAQSLDSAPVAGATSDEWKLVAGAVPPPLTAGTGIDISGSVISSALEAGTGIDIVGATVAVALAQGPGITVEGATISTNLVAGAGISIGDVGGDYTIASTLTEGSGIDISGSVISTIYASDVITVTIAPGASSGFTNITGLTAPTVSSLITVTPRNGFYDPATGQIGAWNLQHDSGSNTWSVVMNFILPIPLGSTHLFQWVQLK